MNSRQSDLFDQTLMAYMSNPSGRLDNESLYESIQEKLSLPKHALESKVSIGKSGQKHNLLKREIRWIQQTLKTEGVLERVEGERGIWRLTQPISKELDQAMPQVRVLGFHTDLGIAILGSCTDTFKKINEPLHLILTSSPYPLAKPRSYGNPSEAEFVNWLCNTIEPLIKNMADGASICINLGNDVFVNKSPARSMYRERLILALYDRFNLQLMNNLVWHNPSKAPGPIQWASLNRFHLNASQESIIWMTNNPLACYANNQRVLEPHSERHLKMVRAGGEKRECVSSDGAYVIHKGSYSKETEGRIPRDVLTFGHACKDQQRYKAYCREQGIKPHGATMPLKLASFLIKFLTRPGQLVADPFGGSFTTAKAAEMLGRRWISTELILQYVAGAAFRFHEFSGFYQPDYMDIGTAA